jgi:cell shape-determining protein MreD
MNWLHTTALFATAFLAVFFESALGSVRHWIGAQIDVLPALMVYAGLSAGLPMVTALAVTGGLWFDSLSANPLGVTVLPLFLIGLFIHLNRALVLRDLAYAQFILGLGASAAAPLLTLVVIINSGSQPLLGWSFVWQWLVMALGGAALTPLLFLFFRRVERALAYQRMPDPAFTSQREIKRGRH